MKLSEIAQKTSASFSGEDIEIFALNSLKNANKAELSYCDGEKNAKFIADSNAGAILISQNLISLVPEGMSALVCENPHLAFAILSKDFAKPLFCEPKPSNIAQSATIMPNVHIGSNVSVGEGSIVMAGVFLGDFVEIGACTTIDRGVFESTMIANYTKIDNLVQIGHNCELGNGCLIVSQTGLAGSTVLGRNVVMGGQSGSAGHVSVGDFAQIAARGGVSKDLPGGKKYAGAYPIMELSDQFKLQAKILRFFKKN